VSDLKSKIQSLNDEISAAVAEDKSTQLGTALGVVIVWIAAAAILWNWGVLALAWAVIGLRLVGSGILLGRAVRPK